MTITRAQTFGAMALVVPFAMLLALTAIFGTMGWTGESVTLNDTSAHAIALSFGSFVIYSTLLGFTTLSLLLSRPAGRFFRAARVVFLGGIAMFLLIPTCVLAAAVLRYQVMHYSVYALWVPCGVTLFVVLLREGAPKKHPRERAVAEPHSSPLTPSI